jgi:hypothetical protein
MKQIPLTKGLVAQVDDEDYSTVDALRWRAIPYKGTHLAVTNIEADFLTYLHRFVMRIGRGDSTCVVHKDGNGLNNCKSNLKVVKRGYLQKRRVPNKQAFSKYKGVGYHRRFKKWTARITINGVTKSLGYYKSEKAAALAYNRAAKAHFGKDAYLNKLKVKSSRSRISSRINH